MSNKFRKEVTVEIDGVSLACRPTLAKISEIEGRFGPALEILRRLGSGTIPVAEMAAIVGIIVKGVSGAPTLREVPELVFAAGTYTFAGPVAEFLGNAISSDEPAPESGEGNAA